MKVCVLFVGVIRPTPQRVIENITKNISYFKTTYPNHTFTFMICAYKNSFYKEVSDYCDKNNVEHHFIEPIQQSDIPKELDLYMYKHSTDFTSKNRYRVFYTMDYILNKISSDAHDCIIRLRTDAEVKEFEILDNILPNTYYTLLEDPVNNRCNDNIAYGTCEVMKNVWALKNCMIKSFNIEELVCNSVKKNMYTITPFKFNYILYQSADAYFDNIVQWSKRNRQWIYDGNKYTVSTVH